MALLVNKLKVKAASRSMHQFCPVVRSMFPTAPPDDVVEAATFFLYLRTAESIFGRRFARRLAAELRAQLKFADAVDLEARVYRIDRHVEEFGRNGGDRPRSKHDEFTNHVQSVMRALLREVGAQFDRPEVVRLIFPRFENAARHLRDHLQGIKRQATFVMR